MTLADFGHELEPPDGREMLVASHRVSGEGATENFEFCAYELVKLVWVIDILQLARQFWVLGVMHQQSLVIEEVLLQSCSLERCQVIEDQRADRGASDEELVVRGRTELGHLALRLHYSEHLLGGDRVDYY